MAGSYVADLLEHFQHQGVFVLLDHRGKTYAGILHEADFCSGLVHIWRGRQPLSRSFADTLVHTITEIRRYTAMDGLPLEEMVHIHANLLDHTLAPITPDQYAYLMSKQS